MANEQVKIEYQFVGEDVGLTSKIDDIYKKLEKLGEGASVTIKKLDGLGDKTITLTNTLNTATGKMEVFSKELLEIQNNASGATKQINELINAMNRLNSSKGNSGAVNNQKQLANATQKTLDITKKLNTEQKKLSSYRNNGTSVKEIQSQARTKAIEASKKAQDEKDTATIISGYKQGKKFNTSTDFKGTSLEVSGKTISSMYRSQNPEVKKLLSEYAKEVEKRDEMLKNLGSPDKKLEKNIAKLNNQKNKLQALRNPANADMSYRVKNGEMAREINTLSSFKNNMDKVKKEIDSIQQQAIKNGVSVKPTDYLNQAIKAQDVLKRIDNIMNKTPKNESQNKNYQVLGDIKKLDGKTLKMASTASNGINNSQNIKQIKEEQKAQESLNDSKKNYLQLTEKQSKQESNKKQSNNNQKTFNQQQQRAYNKAVLDLPNNYSKLTKEYKSMNKAVEDETNKLNSINTQLMSKKGVSKSELKKIGETLADSQKRIADTSKQIRALDEKAWNIASIATNEAKKVSGLKLSNNTKANGNTKTYRVANGSSIKDTKSVLTDVRQYKALGQELGKAQSELSSKMINLSASSMTLGNNLQHLQSGWGAVGNSMQLTGKVITFIGNGINNLGRSMINTGQNVQMLSNSLRTLSLLSASAFTTIAKEGIDFERSLAGVSSAINRVEINPDGSASIMSDKDFDDLLGNIKEKAREQARTSIYDANEVMEAYRYTTLAGWSGQESMESMEALIQMATASRIQGDQFAGLIEDIANSMASLGMVYEGIDIDGDGVFDERIRKNADDMAESVIRLTDVMSKAQAISTLDLPDLVKAYQIGGSQLSSFGLELEEITSLFSVLGNRGIRGSQAGTGVSSIMANLMGKTGQAKKALDEIYQKTGVDVYAWDKNGQYIGIEKHLENLSEAFTVLKKKYGTEYGVDNIQLAQLLGGKHHFKTLTKMLEGYQSGEFTQTLAILKNSQGATAEMADITNQSTWGQLKMTLSEVKEAMMSMWEVIKPGFEALLELVRTVARAFTELSDEQKLNIAKWMAFIVVGVALAGIISSVLMALGSLTSMFGSALSGIGKLFVAIGTIIILFSKWELVVGALVKVFPALGGLDLTLKGVLGTLGLMVGKFIAVAGSVLIFFNNIKLLTRAFRDARAEGEGFFDILGKTISNAGKQLEDESLNIAEKLTKMFNIDQDKLAKNLAKTFSTLIRLADNYINVMTFGISGKLNDYISEKLGIDVKETILERLDNKAKNGMGGKNLFESDLDREAQAKGYDNYEDELRADRIKNTLNKITVLFDGEETGAFSNLIEKIENADGAKVELTTEDVRLDAIDYKTLKDSIKESKTYIDELDGKIEKNVDNILKYNKQLDELKTKINNTSNENTKKKLQKQYDEIKEKRDAEIELKYSNEDEYRNKTAELTKKEDKLITITTEYENAGKKEELEYESTKEEFEQKHGSQLSFVNADEDIEKVKHLKKNVGDIKKELKKKLDSGMLSDGDYIKVYTALEKIDKFESGADKYDDLVRQQEIVKETAKNKKLIQEEIDKQQKVMDDILEKNGLKKGQENKLKGTDKEAYDKANKLKEGHQKDYDEESNKHNLAEKTIEGMGDLQDVYDLWNLIYGNDKPLMKLFDEGELAILRELGFGKQVGDDDTPAMNLKENHKGVITDKSEAVSTVDTENPKNNKNTTKPVQGPEPNFIRFNGKNNNLNKNTEDKEGNNKTTQESNTNTQANTEITTANTKALNDNTEAVSNNNKAKSETPSQQEQVETDTSGVDEFSQKVDTASQEAQANLDNLVAKTTEMSDALGKIDLSGITEAFTVVYVAIEEARTMLSNISGFAVNTGVASFQTMGDALKTAIEGARTILLGICGIASNRGISSLTSMGNSLDSGLQKARSSLLSICNVALHRGVNAMTTMGQALTSALSGAKETVSGIASQINAIKNNINNLNPPALEGSISAPDLSVPSLASNTATMGALRTITNNSVNNSIATTSNFNIDMKGIMGNDRRSIKTTARQLTTYCKRRGL